MYNPFGVIWKENLFFITVWIAHAEFYLFPIGIDNFEHLLKTLNKLNFIIYFICDNKRIIGTSNLTRFYWNFYFQLIDKTSLPSFAIETNLINVDGQRQQQHSLFNFLSFFRNFLKPIRICVIRFDDTIRRINLFRGRLLRRLRQWRPGFQNLPQVVLLWLLFRFRRFFPFRRLRELEGVKFKFINAGLSMIID